MKEDYFDADLEPEASPLPINSDNDAEETTPPAPPIDNPSPKKRQLFGHDLSTLLVAGAAIIALLAYGFWPETPPSRPFIADEVTPSPVIPDPVQAIQAPEPTPEMSAPTISLVPPELKDQQFEEMKQYSAANREAMTVLTGRMSDAERRLAALETQLRALAAKSTVPPPVTATAKTVKQVPRTKTAATRSPIGVKGWRIHTVYPGMAWITRNGSTWAIQTGDVLQGITIRSIDAQRRIVVTDKGVIR